MKICFPNSSNTATGATLRALRRPRIAPTPIQGGAVAQSLECGTPGQEVVGSVLTSFGRGARAGPPKN